MKKIPSSFRKQLRSFLPWAINLLFLGSVCWIIAISELPPVTEPVFSMRQQFLEGNETLFKLQDPRLAFAIFKPYLPQKGSMSFLTDTPYTPKQSASEQLQAAQAQLAPLVINPEPTENIALVFCSQNAAAAARMQAAGYRATATLGNGKLIAEKRS